MIDKSPIYDLISRLHVMKPNSIDPENVKQVLKMEELFNSPEYANEEKLDGCRYFMTSCLFFSSDHVEKTDNFPHLRDFFMKLGMPNLILDGEINYPGKTSQYCTRVTGGAASTAISFQDSNGYIHYTMYDILRTPKGNWLIKEPYHKRRKMLEYFYDHYIKGTSMEQYIHISRMTVDNKKQFTEEILAAGGEGSILKKINSFYIMGKKPMWAWMKVKQKDAADMIITGFTAPTKEYTGKDYASWPYWIEENGVNIPVSKYYYHDWIGAVELSAYVGGELTIICTSSGISESLREDMSQNPNKYLNKVARVGFMEKTEAGYPRHPKIENIHETKQPNECTWDFE